METLSITLLGPFHAALGPNPLAKFRTNRVQALLIYLAVEHKQHHRREALMELLWPGLPQQSAQVNLRQTLYQLRKMIPEVMGRDGKTAVSFLITDRQSIQIHPDAAIDLDLATFDKLAKQAEKSEEIELMEQTSALYRGDFLADFYLPDSETFEQWANTRREAYRRQVLELLHSLATRQIESKQFNEAETAVRRQLTIDPLRDIAHRQLIELLARSGRRSDALIQYDTYCRLMTDELGVDPSTDIIMLHQHIISGDFEPPLPTTPEAPAIEKPFSAERRKQLILVEKVKQAWVHGVLEDATAMMPLIQLTIENRSEAVDMPWQGIIPERENGRFPSPNQSYHDLFVASDRALLILGPPGAGKTLALISLAQDLIALAETDASQPIPVILNLSTWAESEQNLSDWVVEELTVKYQIPHKIGRSWLEKDQLLLLLDGLDEMLAPAEVACVQAINQFRETHGLTGLVVCCRSDDYAAIGQKLRLGGGIGLRPLTTQQIEMALASGGEQWAGLKTALLQNADLQHMAQSPLMLSLLRLAYSGDVNTPASQSQMIISDLSSKDISVRRQHLFATYIQRMFHRRRTTSSKAKQTVEWLTWLAQKMFQHNQSVFLIEQIQPSWLQSSRQRQFYLVINRLISGTLIGTLMWFALIIGLQTEFDLSFVLYRRVAEFMRLPLILSTLLFQIFWNTILAIVIALFDIFRYESRKFPSNIVPDWIISAGLGVIITASTLILFVSAETLLDAFAYGTLNGIFWGFGYHFTLLRPNYHIEIHAVEALNWSWNKALKSLYIGIPIGIFISWVFIQTAPDHELSRPSGLVFTILIFLLRGLQQDQLETKSRPNQGIHLSFRNSVLVSFIFGIALGLPWIIFIDWAAGISLALMGVLTGGIIYGGLDTVKHVLVRLGLKMQKDLPWNYAEFLDEAAELALLRKVGGGYIFVHRLLQAYFAQIGPADEFVFNRMDVDGRDTAVSLLNELTK